VTDSREFTRDLEAENAAFWRELTSGSTPTRRPPFDSSRSAIALYEAEILPDEYRHAAIGRRALHLLADTRARQATARWACQEMNQRVAGAYREHRARADRGE